MGAMRKWIRASVNAQDARRVLLDAALVVVVAAVNVITISSATVDESSIPPDLIAYALGFGMALTLVMRRRWPVGTLLAATAVFTAYNRLSYPGFVPALPLAVQIYTASAAGHLRWPIVISLFYTVGPLVYQISATDRAVSDILNEVLRDTGFFVAIMLLGEAVRGRRLHAADVTEQLERAQADSERVREELKVAHLVQEQFLPSELPEIPGWRVHAFYRAAREVGGDFYSFTELDGRGIGIAIGDVTDKGAPAALIMATTQALLRSEAPRWNSPSEVLERLNEVLVADTPDKMFATCTFLALDPQTGRVRFANAGHPLPYMTTDGRTDELRATGMPLGLLPGSRYEPAAAVLPRGSRLLLHSDGLAEAHNRDGEMFGLPRIEATAQRCPLGDDLIGALLTELDDFTGPAWEQEDDITLVTLERL